MQTPEGLGHVAVPADRTISRKDVWKLLRPEILPFDRLVIRRKQGWSVIEVMERTNLFVTKHATLPFIPLRDNIPHQAVLGINFNLLQALLAAILALGPAGTFLEAKRGFGEKGAEGGFSGSNLDRSGLVRLRAGDQAFSSIAEVRPYAGDCTENKEPNRQQNDCKNNKRGDRHEAPPVSPAGSLSVLEITGTGGVGHHPRA